MITELAKAIGPECEHPVVGIRPGEKLHEEMITVSDSQSTIEAEKYFVIVPGRMMQSADDVMTEYLAHYNAKRVPDDFCYSSGNNTEWVDADHLRELIRTHVDPGFSI